MKSEEIIEQLTKVKVEDLDEDALEFYNFVIKKLDYINELEKEIKYWKDGFEEMIQDKIDERKYELQQQYKDFKDDEILEILQELLKDKGKNKGSEEE